MKPKSRRFLKRIPIIIVVVGIVIFVVVVMLPSLSAPNTRLTSMTLNQSQMTPLALVPTVLPRATQIAQGGQPIDILTSNTNTQSQPVTPPAPQQQRIILRDATLTLIVDDVDTKFQAISALASEFGGWIVTATANRTLINNESRVSSAYITIRVPAERLDEALTQIKDGVRSVEIEQINGQDVTQDYVDLNSRLGNLRAAETQLQRLLDEAEDTEAVLGIYTELVRVRGEIETIVGRLNYYDEAAAYSLINVTLRLTPTPPTVQVAQGWSPQTTANRALQVLVNLLQGTVDLLISLVVIVVPMLIVIGIPALIIWRVIRRRNRLNTKSPTASSN